MLLVKYEMLCRLEDTFVYFSLQTQDCDICARKQEASGTNSFTAMSVIVK